MLYNTFLQLWTRKPSAKICELDIKKTLTILERVVDPWLEPGVPLSHLLELEAVPALSLTLHLQQLLPGAHLSHRLGCPAVGRRGGEGLAGGTTGRLKRRGMGPPGAPTSGRSTVAGRSWFVNSVCVAKSVQK